MTSIQEKKVFASLPCTERGKGLRLTGDPKCENYLYCNGHNVYIRNMEDPLKVEIYAQHAKLPTVARYSPKRFYIASADMSGKIMIWDTVNPEHILKYEYEVLGGEVRDISWDCDGKKIAVCGAGASKYAHVFNMDTGSSVGELTGHVKAINTISYRQVRPFSLVTAGEDQIVTFFKGPPFKFTRTQNTHTTFVNVARYNAKGDVILSGGSDGKLVMYNGDMENPDETHFGSPAHKGGIYELCFSPDDSEVLTASGDKTAKIFDVATGKEMCVFKMDEMARKSDAPWHDMQLGCLWQGDEIITVNGLGHIIYHDRNNPQKPKRVIKGHMKPITALALSEDKRTAFTGGQEGIVYWNVENGENDTFSGKGHSSEVRDMTVEGDRLYSVGVDDTLRVSSVTNKNFSDIQIKLDSQPRGLDCRNGVIVVACVQHLLVFEACRGAGDASLSKKFALDKLNKLEPSSVSIHPDGSSVAIGFKDKQIKIYSMQNFSLTEQKTLPTGEAVDCLAYSPDGSRLAYNSNMKVGVCSTTDYEKVGAESSNLTGRVCCMAWSPDSERFAVGSIDGLLTVHKKDMPPGSKVSTKAHFKSYFNKVCWVDPCTIITAGQDSNVKQFTVTN
ncbi:WD repeat-containing protein 1-A-like [Babylonia areolata]|uniref:WD repeat-containing protein 1-A-like n=1 Tax=Babylonia areolata TaxID=304850 RepID=UPI003FD422E0